MVFLKNSQPVLQDAQVRRALLAATNTNQARNGLGYLTVPATEPLLQRDVGYDKTLMQDGYDPVKSAQLLDQAGWKLGSDGVRIKDGKQLAFTLFSQNSQDYTTVAKALQKQWRAVGVKADVILQNDSDLQTTLSLHSYDALLYGISLGTDPDVFAYWHSSQADVRSASRLNFSEYKSTSADQALEAGRTRTDPAIRAIKYKPFLEAWHTDVPAIGLYQPRFLYVTNGQLFGLKEHSANTATDRYANVENWMIHQAQTVK
jgi:peptide/nickel transport system substrate-binding protein